MSSELAKNWHSPCRVGNLAAYKFEDMRGCVELDQSSMDLVSMDLAVSGKVRTWSVRSCVVRARLFVRWWVNKHFQVVLPVPALRR
eukprot:COSAG06_NODE_3726_length_4971_cov_20.589901_5_plen_86_part_00